MSSITVIKPTFKTELPVGGASVLTRFHGRETRPERVAPLENPVTLSESDEQAQLAHQEALWQDRCDYYESAR